MTTKNTEVVQERILRTEYSDIMQKSYIDYAMSVIVARALPDVRDGLKPVQRRTLYDMHELNLRWDRPYRKSARIVGDTMGKYHPHGDSSIYGALVVLAQDFKMGLPLVDGHGNFGSIEGDGAAAMRYTEARLSRVAQEVFLSDMDKGVVPFVPNFDETEKEPEVLPVRIPNLLVNGSEGIAVGMVTSIPTHNLGEVIDAVVALIKDGELSDDELFEIVQGPDFPTGGIVVNKDDLKEIYRTGNGKIRVRGRVSVENMKGGKQALVITEIPYTMIGANIAKFLNDVAALVDNKTAADIADISNQSSKEGIRIVIELKKGADPEYIERLLYKKTRLEDSFGVNMLAVADGRPETLSLRRILEHHIDFQFEVTTKKYQTMLDKELAKKEIQEGLIKACDVIDLIIEILRGCRTQSQAKACLIAGETEGIKFKSEESKKMAAQLRFTENQASAILDMRLAKLIGLEIEALMKEHENTVRNIESYTDILNNYASMAKVIIKELTEYKKLYARERRTSIVNAGQVVFEEKKKEAFPVVLLMDRFGYARAVDENVYEKNKEAADSENRIVLHTMSDARVSIFTDIGRQHILRMEDVPYGKFRDKGTPIDNLCNYDSAAETYLYVTQITQEEEKELLFVTQSGLVKRVATSEFAVVSKRTIQASKLDEGDRLVLVAPAGEKDQLLLVTGKGFYLRFKLDQTPVQKKAAKGVRGIRLGEEDSVTEGYVLSGVPGEEVTIGGNTLQASRVKLASRDTKGTKLRL